MTRRTLTGAMAVLALALALPFQAQAAARLESRLEIGFFLCERTRCLRSLDCLSVEARRAIYTCNRDVRR